MIGTLVNCATILTGSFIGSRLKKGIREEHQEIMMQAMGLAATALGINAIVKYMPQSEYPVLFIVSLALGGLLGERYIWRTSLRSLSPGFPMGIWLRAYPRRYCCSAWEPCPFWGPWRAH